MDGLDFLCNLLRNGIIGNRLDDTRGFLNHALDLRLVFFESRASDLIYKLTTFLGRLVTREIARLLKHLLDIGNNLMGC